MWAYLRDLVLDKETWASNPGRLPVDLLLFTRCFPRWPLLIGSALVLAAVAAVAVHWAFWLLFAVLLWALVVSTQGVVEQFCNGCVNPGQVVSVEQGLVAVCTDLRSGPRPAPVIKVLPQPLHRIPGGPPPVGARVAAVAVYHGTSTGVRWDDFSPLLAQCATRDEEELRRVMESISPEDWAELEAGLAQIPTPFAPGLYRVDFPRGEASGQDPERETAAVWAGMRLEYGPTG